MCFPHDWLGCRSERTNQDLTIYSYRIITKTSCPRGVLPEASWSGAGSAPAAGADACSGLGRPKANSGKLATASPSEIRPPHTTMGPCHGTTRRQGPPCARRGGGLRTEIAGWDAGTPAFSINKEPAPWRPAPLAVGSSGAREANLSTNNSGRKDRENDTARDHAPHMIWLG